MCEQTTHQKETIETYYVIKIKDNNYHISRDKTATDIMSAYWINDKIKAQVIAEMINTDCQIMQVEVKSTETVTIIKVEE